MERDSATVEQNQVAGECEKTREIVAFKGFAMNEQAPTLANNQTLNVAVTLTEVQLHWSSPL